MPPPHDASALNYVKRLSGRNGVSCAAVSSQNSSLVNQQLRRFVSKLHQRRLRHAQATADGGRGSTGNHYAPL